MAGNPQMPKCKTGQVLLLPIMGATILAIAAAGAKPQSSEAYQNAFDSWMKQHRPAMAVAVVRQRGETTFSKGHNVDPQTPTLISSLSKPITGVCVATLVRDGKLAFTTPLRDAMAGFFRRHGPPADRRVEEVTVEQLLTHRSGFPGLDDDDRMLAIWKRRAINGLAHIASPEPLLVEHFRHRLIARPGTNASYSNTNFIVLTAIIEEISGQTYEDYCRATVFDKLGVTTASLHPDWRMFSGARGWIISGVDYLKFLDVFDPKHPFLGDTVKQWIVAAEARFKSANAARQFDGLGIPTTTQPGGWRVVHSGILLNFRGRRPNGRAIRANIHAHAYREADGFGLFLAMTPVRMGDILGKLDKAMHAVHDTQTTQ